MKYDVLIIGGGVVGSSIARELSRYRVKVGVLEKNCDVCYGNSGRNTGLLHAGFLYQVGSIKSRFCIEGNRDFDQIANELDIPIKRTGKLTVGFSSQDRERLEKLIERGTTNGIPGMRMLERKELKSLEPHVSGEFAMITPTSAIINPYKYTIALAENACVNGVKYHLGEELIKSERLPCGVWRLYTNKNKYEAEWVINSSGYNADIVAKILGFNKYELYNSKGEYLILDKKAGQFLTMPVYPAPDDNWKYDVHVTPTVDGNVLVGPTIIDDPQVNRGQFDTTQQGLNELFEKGKSLFLPMNKEMIIRSFAGQFPHVSNPTKDDFILEVRDEDKTIHLIGIDSPGLTCANILGKWATEQIVDRVGLVENKNFNPKRKGITSFFGKNVETQNRMIQKDPDYGEIICRCESITRAEIIQAIQNPLGVVNVNGIKYRTRATMGRCQGGYCQTRIAAIISQELNINYEDILYQNDGSYMFTGKVRS